MDIYTLSYVTQITVGTAVCPRELKPGSVTNERGKRGWKGGGRFKREGTYVYLC